MIINSKGSARNLFESLTNKRVHQNNSLLDAIENGSNLKELGDSKRRLTEELVELAIECSESHLDEEDIQALTLLILTLLVHSQNGSSFLPLYIKKNSPLVEISGRILRDTPFSTRRYDLLQNISSIRTAPNKTPLIGTKGSSKPFLLENGNLYFHKSLVTEDSLSRLITARFSRTEIPFEKKVHLRPTFSAEQKQAVQIALKKPLTIISGGPGTGKTTVISEIVRILKEEGINAEAIRIAAPTGKAVSRLFTSLSTKEFWDETLKIQTIHRLLQYNGKNKQFSVSAHNPLHANTVIIDEASMVDIYLLNALMRATHNIQRLILVGDANQLPSVNAGSVFRDLTLNAKSVITLSKNYRVSRSEKKANDLITVATVLHSKPSHEWRDFLNISQNLENLLSAGIQLIAPEYVEKTVLQFNDFKADHDAVEKCSKNEFLLCNGKLQEEDDQIVKRCLLHYSNRRILTATNGHVFGSRKINQQLHSIAQSRSRTDYQP